MKADIEIGMNGPKAVVCSEIRTYAYLLSGAKAEVMSVQQADLSENEKLFKSINSILLTAFFVEAYLNHVGSIKVSGWDILEKKLSPKEKLEIIKHEIEFIVDFSREPFQTFKKVFDARNALAHGKTENIKKESEGPTSVDDFGALQASWTQFCIPENAINYFKNMEELAKNIHAAAKLDPSDFYTFSTGFILERMDR